MAQTITVETLQETITIEPRAATIYCEVDGMGALRVIPDQVLSLGSGGLRAFGPLFDPVSLPNLSFWASADRLSGLNDGDAIDTWSDVSGNGFNATAATVARPIYKTNQLAGRPVVRFDGSNNYMRTADASSPGITQPSTVFLVGKATGLDQTLFDAGTVALKQMIDRSSDSASPGSWRMFAGSSVVSASQKADGKYNIITAQFNGASSFMRVGGYQIAAGNVNTGAITGVTLGARGGSAAQKLNGDLFAVLVYARALSLSEIQQVENWLHGLTGLNADGGLWNIVFEGDSLTAGTGATGLGAYPTQTTLTYMPTIPSARLLRTNSGTGGATLANMISDAATIDALYDASKSRNVLVVWGGTNDFGVGADEPTTYGRLVSLCENHRAAGWKVAVLTMLPRNDAGKPAGFDANRATFNAAVRANWSTFSDLLVDVAVDSRIGDDGDCDDTTYYNADKIHMTNAGYDIVASLTAAQIGTL